jgi:competence protein ComEC
MTEESFRSAGLSHLVAVSGSNVSIVVGCVLVAGGRVSLRARLLVAALALGFYVLIVGPEPSVLRAAAMGAVGLAALATGRRAEPLVALVVALLILLAVRPALLWSVGLYLSALASAGLVLWARPVARRFGWLPAPIALGLAATLAAQFAVVPLLVGVFGELSLVGPLANVLALPAVAPATVLAIGAGVSGAVAPPLGELLARCAEPLARWVVTVAEVTGSWSWAAVQPPRAWGWVSGGMVVLAAVVALIAAGGASGERGLLD